MSEVESWPAANYKKSPNILAQLFQITSRSKGCTSWNLFGILVKIRMEMIINKGWTTRLVCSLPAIWHHPTPRIPYSYYYSYSYVTKSVKWRYLRNQAWLHRSAGVKLWKWSKLSKSPKMVKIAKNCQNGLKSSKMVQNSIIEMLPSPLRSAVSKISHRAENRVID